jgi:hypothetical protein
MMNQRIKELAVQSLYKVALSVKRDAIQICEQKGQFDAAHAIQGLLDLNSHVDIIPPAVQEPDGYVYGNSYWEATNLRITDDVKRFGSPRYATPPAAQRQWVDLPPQQIDELAELHGLDYMSYDAFTKALIAKLKEANT